MTAPPDYTTTDTSAIIAALRTERDAAVAREAALAEALAKRNSEYGERIEQQSATIDVLKVMSASPGDPQPVFDLIVERARVFCEADGAMVTLLEDGMLHLRTHIGATQAASAAYEAYFPCPVDDSTTLGRAVLTRASVHNPNLLADPGYRMKALTSVNSVRSNAAVPILRGGVPIGAIGINWLSVGEFPTAQLELLKTFAEQAVIAITSAETYRALQTRTADLQESLEYQTATSDVLKVISRSTFDLQPVLDTLVETATRLCDAEQAVVMRRDGESFHLAAKFGFPPEYEAFMRARGALFTLTTHAPTVAVRAALERSPVHIHDVAAVPDYPEGAIKLGKQRTSLGVPLLREGEVIGVLLLARQRVEPFTDRQIELVSTFADQAVIAIENTRLITEQREALEQQTATAEVLQVINTSLGDLTPVFDAMLEKAMRLCEAAYGVLRSFDGAGLDTLASRGVPSEYAEFLARNADLKVVLGVDSISGTLGQALRTGQPRQILDVREGIAYKSRGLGSVAIADLGGARTILHVPLVKDLASVGLFTIYRQEIRGFSDRQIALVENFAAQAVIAMDNARLLTEQREALEQQTATAEVLGVINSSPGDLAPVFDAMLEKAMRLCGASFGILRMFEGGRFHGAASRGVPAAYAEFLASNPQQPQTGSIGARILDGEPLVHVIDVADDRDYLSSDPHRRALVELGGARTTLVVPLTKDRVVLGAIQLYRQHVQTFTDKQIALLQNFAAQAVIAMENARLLTEQREALEQQTATAEVLQVINASPGDLAPVFEAMLEKALRLCDAVFGNLWTYDGEVSRLAAICGASPEYRAELMRLGPQKPEPGGSLLRLVKGEPLVHIADIATEGAHRSGVAVRRMLADRAGARTVLWVPLRKDGALLGFFAIYRTEVRPFTDKQIALLQTFAAQAVIAMENARLLTEQREALEQQTAMADVLRVINESPGDLPPVFDAILDRAHRLCGVTHGGLVLRDGDTFRAVATHSYSGTFGEQLRKGYRGADNPITRSLMAGARFVHFPDLAQIDHPMVRASVELAGVRTGLYVPLRKDDVLLGMISSARGEIRPFSEKEITLVENFAAYAVIAMENARLLTEQREALEQQTATAEVLGVINQSPGNLAPVFDAMLEKATRLCDAEYGQLGTYGPEGFRGVAAVGLPMDSADALSRIGHPPPETVLGRVERTRRTVQMADIWQEPTYVKVFAVNPWLRRVHTALVVPMLKEGELIGVFNIFREEVRPFSDKQIALLENFAAQAVIAMENARLLDEIRQRQEELRITFENMGDGVAMFDEAPRLVAWNRKFQDILDVPDEAIAERRTFDEYIRYLTERGEFGRDADPNEQIRRLHTTRGHAAVFERIRPNGRIIEVRQNPVPSGGFVLIYADITERKRNEAEIRAARDAAEEASRTIEAAYRDLKAAQANLIQAEKMASLGQLTAGIAHEIKNPLNFVNNFAALSVDLLGELKETAAPGFAALTDDQRAEIDDVSAMLTSNLEKITEHGKRADGIVKAMLEHSRGSSAERRMVDLNVLIDEALNLAYHGARAQDQSFNITLERDFAEGIAPIEVNPQDITRVFLNIFSNGFYAATRRARNGGDTEFVPTLKVTTRDTGEVVEIRVRDNGTGIPAEIRDKLFQPFFTTKPTGEGTGLGLSITYDIVTKQHGGTITVDSEVDAFTEFVITLPRQMFTTEGDRA